MKKIILLFGFFTVIIFKPLSAQNKAEIEKLQTQISNTFTVRPDSAKVYLCKLLTYSKQLSDSLLARTYTNLGVTYGQTEQADSSRFYWSQK